MDEPITRNEQYLQGAVNAANGQATGDLPEPITREEKYLKGLVDAIENGGGGGGLPVVTQQDDGKVLKVENGQWMADSNAPLTEVSYATLVELRDNGKLIPGQQYRIINYETIINGSYNLSALGAEGYIHYARSTEESWFDIIVTADDESHLNENARAARSDGVTYAPDAKPEAWELKYTIDNDTTRFAWADAYHGKGVIYFMRDEHNNSAGYDFKSIQFLRYALKLADATADYTPYDIGHAYDAPSHPNRYGTPMHIFAALQSYMETGNYVNPFGIGYKGHSAYNYDFAVGYNILGTIQFPEADDTYLSTFNADWYYTFDYLDGNGVHWDITSETISGVTTPYNNQLSATPDALSYNIDSTTRLLGLPATVFESNSTLLSTNYQECHDNTIGVSFALTFGGNCYDNKIADSCSLCMFGRGFVDNVLAFACHENTFGIASISNILEADCSNNFAGSMARSKLGANCSFISTDGNGTIQDTLIKNCTYITLPYAWSPADGEVNGYGTSAHATAIDRIAYNSETAVSTTDGGATWA